MEKKGVVIVTGSCGRIGTQIVKRLASSYSIVGFELLKAIYAAEKEELVPVDLSSDESVHQAFSHIKSMYGKKISSVIHLAAYYSFKDQFSPLYDKITVRGTHRLLEQLKNFEVEQFIFTSTMLVHQPQEPGHPITEDSPLRTDWGYPLSKVQTEKLIHEQRGKIPTVILRVAGVYDDVCHSIPISHQIQRIYEKSLESRLFSGNVHHGASFIHMQDLVDALELCVEKRKSLPEESTLLMGEPKTLSYDQMQKSIARLLGQKEFKTFQLPKLLAKLGAWMQGLLPSDTETFIKPWMVDLADDHYELCIDRAKKLLDWSPKCTLEETLPKMVDALLKDPLQWYKKNGLHMPYSLRRKFQK